MRPPSSPNRIEAIILDVDGTLLRGKEPIPGIVELYQYLRSRQMPFVVASNNSTKSPADYQKKLAAFGVKLEAADILTSGVATAAYLQREFPAGSSCYVIGEAALREAISGAGFVVQEDARERAVAVVVGGDSGLTYHKLKTATLLLQRGARFVGTNPDVVYPTEEGLVPEAGTTLAALQAATGRKPVVIGKPERHLFDLAVRHMGSHPSTTAVVGDRLETDIVGGQRAGLRTILTTTGVDDEATMVQKDIRPDWVVHGPMGLIELLERLNADHHA
jgi:4-nitrophenyl phosphatase